MWQSKVVEMAMKTYVIFNPVLSIRRPRSGEAGAEMR